MDYFKKVKENDKVFGLVYGKGIVKSVWDNSHYSFEVEYENGSFVPYTSEGYPGWNTGKLNFQTVFYASDINLMKYDFVPGLENLSVKKIIKLRNHNKLEIKCPSGIWQSVEKCPESVMHEYLENNELHLFRQKNM